ncbi:F-box protein At5g03100-like [Nicotiana tabacum]|uniref:F-box protein At5g03100-like n=1 Tax=Nicotiana tabacum TaxID=4097 RepID=A0AC58SNV4_TOBAC|nr:F-box protein At5g03100-like [Nicotiana tomentosiformis]
MEMQRKIMASGEGDRLSDLPDAILLYILSMLLEGKEVVRTSVLSQRWRFLWKSVAVSLNFGVLNYPYDERTKKKILAFVASINRELHYWRSCEKIKAFSVFPVKYKEYLVKDYDFWVHFAMKVANVEEFTLKFCIINFPDYVYKFPQFAYKNTSLRNLVLRNCGLNPSGSVNWSSLVSLSIGRLKLTDCAMEKILSGCPKLESLELDNVLGIRRLVISSVKLRKLIILNDEITYYNQWHEEDILPLEIFAPYIQNLVLSGFLYNEIRLQQSNVASLVTAVLHLNVDFVEFKDEEEKLEKEFRYLKELLLSVGHVENLELGPLCIECFPILELRGWRSPLSGCKFLKLNAALKHLDFAGIYSFLQSSSDLETLVIDWNNHKPIDRLLSFTKEVEQSRRFEAHKNCSLLHLKTIKIINFHGKLSGNDLVLRLVKYLLENATVLEKLVIVAKYEGSDVPRDYVEVEQEFLSFPRSSLHASVVFCYR